MMRIKITYDPFYLHQQGELATLEFYASSYRYQVEDGYLWHYLKPKRDSDQRDPSTMHGVLHLLGFRSFPTGELRAKEPLVEVGQRAIVYIKVTE